MTGKNKLLLNFKNYAPVKKKMELFLEKFPESSDLILNKVYLCIFNKNLLKIVES